LKIFSYGVYINTNNNISKQKAWKISLTSYLLLIVMFFMLVITFIFGLKFLFSLISIESSTQG
ncbi:MAG: hypothetical protein ACTSQG_06075, partial [Promethearchaeota archaeon]